MRTMPLEDLEEMVRKISKDLCAEFLSLRYGSSRRKESLCHSLVPAFCVLGIIFLSIPLDMAWSTGTFGIGISKTTKKQ